MRTLLTRVVVRRSGNVARSDVEFDSDAVRIGRGVSNEIPLTGLSVALHHASIVSRSDGVYLVPKPPETVLLRGRRIDGEMRLAENDAIRIGAYEIRVTSLRGEHDVALEVQIADPPESELEALKGHASLGIERGMWSRRLWSWLAMGAVATACLALPLLSGSQRSWSTGPLANAHASIATECGACHTPFQPVANEACLACHPLTASHVEVRTAFPDVTALRCAGCHLEHGGKDGLAALQDTRCAGCHADIEQKYDTRLVSASDFGAHHPEFTLHMLRPGDGATSADPKPELVRESWSLGAREDSGLKFSHLAHVGGVKDLVDGSQSTMRCGKCHRLDEGGRRMQPIRFEDHCESCHTLNYGNRQIRGDVVPHAKPGELQRYLRRAFLDAALPREPGETEGEQRIRQLRFTRPGVERSEEEERLILKVDGQVEKSLGLLMTDEYCGKCHTLLPQDSVTPTDVVPPAITRAWLGSSRFDHSSHSATRCGICHPRAAVLNEEYAAITPGFDPAPGTDPGDSPYGLVPSAELRSDKGLEPSESASDVLLLGRTSCTDSKCHAGSQAAPPFVASPCVMCHPYHQPGGAAIAPQVSRFRPTVDRSQE